MEPFPMNPDHKQDYGHMDNEPCENVQDNRPECGQMDDSHFI